MASVRPRRAAEDSPKRALNGGGSLVTLRRRVVDAMLWTLGTLGAISLIAAVAAHIWGFSIILFSTGSMSPTIPAGSAALVRLIPAPELEVGDVTTVERPGQLPITHRITTIEPLAGNSAARVITMRGDANAIDDAAPYVVSDARIVVASMPGVATWFANLRDARLMGLLTLLAGALVTWAFWPRQARRATVVAAAAVVAGSQLLAPTEAQAAEIEYQVAGRHLVLTVVSDEAKMSSMVPGQPVLWQVGIDTAGDEEGAVHVGLGLVDGSVAADALRVDVLACPERWQGETCSGAAESWISDATLDQAFLPSTHGDTRELGTTAAGDPVWVQVRATLDRQEPNVSATLKVDAWGAGEMVSAETDGNGGHGSGNGLAYTGADGISETLALAGAAIGTGLVVARLAGGRRRDAEREVAR
jgi:signal peptidase